MTSLPDPPAARPFDLATAVAAQGAGRLSADVDAGWATPTAANGGYLAAICVRALEAHLAGERERRLRSLTVHYLRPVGPGPLTFELETVRSGRRLTTVRLTAAQAGKPALAGIAALASPDLPAVGSWFPAPPPAAPPPPRDAPGATPDRWRHDDDGHWLALGDDAPSITHRVKLAPRFGGIPFSGHRLPAGAGPETGGWIALPTPQPIDAAVLALYTDVRWPPGFEPLDRPAAAPTIDLTIHFRADIPPAGIADQPVLGWYRSSTARDGLVEEDGMLFLADGTLLAHSRQLALLMPIDG